MFRTGPGLSVTAGRHPLIGGIITFVDTFLTFFAVLMLVGGFTHENLNGRFHEHLFVSFFTALTVTLGMYFIGRRRRGEPDTGQAQ